MCITRRINNFDGYQALSPHGFPVSFSYRLLILLLLVPFLPVQGQQERFIYSRVQTLVGNVYTVQIRWRANPVFWRDILLDVKTEVPVLQYLSNEQIIGLNGEKIKVLASILSTSGKLNTRTANTT